MTGELSRRPSETISVRTKAFTQLEDAISAMRCMASINERVLSDILDNDRFSEGPGQYYHVPMTLEMVRDLRFTADELMRRMDGIAESIDILSAEAFDAPR